jgi:hypothetical protein
MLNQPSIFKVPSATSQTYVGNAMACSNYAAGPTCSPYNGTCVDTGYDTGNVNDTLTVVGVIAGVVAIFAS